MECPFSLKLRCSHDGQILVVTSFNNEHNHEISEVRYILIRAGTNVQIHIICFKTSLPKPRSFVTTVLSIQLEQELWIVVCMFYSEILNLHC